MTFNCEKFCFIPLGGLGEVGMNCYAIECEGKLLVVDCGVTFSRENAGVDFIIPDFKYLAGRSNEIEAIVITHAHEDHIGAVSHFPGIEKIPVYASNYCMQHLRRRFKKKNIKSDLRVISHKSPVLTGPFKITPFEMPHSIPGNLGLVIDMPGGRVLHTGDFKLDRHPDKNPKALLRLQRLSDGKTDLMLCDSTGSEEHHAFSEEGGVFDSLFQLAESAKSRVFVTLFPSNIKRIETVLKIAASLNRKVLLMGRSVTRHVRIAEEAGLLKIQNGLIEKRKDAVLNPKNRLMIIIAGSQGEAGSALGRLTRETRSDMQVEKGDLVIMSSRIIPGNEVSVHNIIDRLFELGAQVVYRDINKSIHVSGHGSKDDIKHAIEHVKPKSFIPVHGTRRHLVASSLIAKSAGVKDVAVVTNGTCVAYTDDGITIKDSFIPSGRVYMDGNIRIPWSVIRERNLLGYHGIVMVTVSDSGGMEVKNLSQENSNIFIRVSSKGVAKGEELEKIHEMISDETSGIMAGVDGKEKELLNDELEDIIGRKLKKLMSKQFGFSPVVQVLIFQR